jgi:hypothetical protein
MGYLEINHHSVLSYFTNIPNSDLIRHYFVILKCEVCGIEGTAQLFYDLEYVFPKIDQHCDLNQGNEDQKLKELNSISKIQDSRMGRSSSLVRTLALRAKGRRFKSGSAHHPLFSVVKSKYLLNYTLRTA